MYAENGVLITRMAYETERVKETCPAQRVRGSIRCCVLGQDSLGSIPIAFIAYDMKVIDILLERNIINY
jgi:hypothetical protein